LAIVPGEKFEQISIAFPKWAKRVRALHEKRHKEFIRRTQFTLKRSLGDVDALKEIITMHRGRRMSSIESIESPPIKATSIRRAYSAGHDPKVKDITKYKSILPLASIDRPKRTEDKKTINEKRFTTNLSYSKIGRTSFEKQLTRAYGSAIFKKTRLFSSNNHSKFY